MEKNIANNSFDNRFQLDFFKLKMYYYVLKNIKLYEN